MARVSILQLLSNTETTFFTSYSTGGSLPGFPVLEQDRRETAALGFLLLRHEAEKGSSSTTLLSPVSCSPHEDIRRYDPLIQAQARELTHLRQKLQEGKDVCYFFMQHAKNTVKSFESLLRSTDVTYYQRQRFCELLAQGSQLAETLASKLITGNHHDRKDEDGQEPLAPRLSRGLQEEEVNEVLEDSLDERYLTHSSLHDSHQPPSSNAFVCDVQEATSAVDVARCTSHFYGQILESTAQLYNENRHQERKSEPSVSPESYSRDKWSKPTG
ncbi:hypothetical protein E2I00_005742 [Balaenoptera physalus]|uniref:Olduvai domain-containing protein n=1 Tax=Balaenoptera physalus TaxID=9770 RepID=A0A643BP81_BALPH|nr:hypothetical protein E2I00_005742 [Balaenoptera physalus]